MFAHAEAAFVFYVHDHICLFCPVLTKISTSKSFKMHVDLSGICKFAKEDREPLGMTLPKTPLSINEYSHQSSTHTLSL